MERILRGTVILPVIDGPNMGRMPIGKSEGDVAGCAVAFMCDKVYNLCVILQGTRGCNPLSSG